MDASAHGAGEGGFETRPYVTPVQAYSPLGRGAAAAAGWFPRRAHPRPNPPKPPSLEGGSVRRRGGCPPQGVPTSKPFVSDI
ncbi:MAG: hypothetical protein LBM98_11560 [Oscillospiraceae bacterium]|nr:hypothetical protein [Oscillospiraceae bacterium]